MPQRVLGQRDREARAGQPQHDAQQFGFELGVQAEQPRVCYPDDDHDLSETTGTLRTEMNSLPISLLR